MRWMGTAATPVPAHNRLADEGAIPHKGISTGTANSSTITDDSTLIFRLLAMPEQVLPQRRLQVAPCRMLRIKVGQRE